MLRLAQTQQQSVSTQPVTAHQNSTALMDCAPVPRQPTWVSNQDPNILIMTSQMIQFNCSWLFNSIVAVTCTSVCVFFLISQLAELSRTVWTLLTGTVPPTDVTASITRADVHASKYE